jgi:hypothetical protein
MLSITGECSLPPLIRCLRFNIILFTKIYKTQRGSERENNEKVKKKYRDGSQLIVVQKNIFIKHYKIESARNG